VTRFFSSINILLVVALLFSVASCVRDEVIPERIGPTPEQKDDPEPETDPEPQTDPEPETDPEPQPKPYSIPKIHIWTDGAAPVQSKTEYVSGCIKVEDPLKYFSDVDILEAPILIRGRGNSTWGMPKKPYKIKFEEKQSVLGIHKDKEWVLLANYSDKSLLRNIVAMELSRRLGFSWTPTMISVELWMNDEYQGVYSFTEHKKVSKHRVNISEDGVYMEFENESINEPCYFKTGRYGVTLMFHEPENPSEALQKEVKDFVNAFESTLYALGHDDRGAKNYQDYIDVDSFVNYYILNELCKDPDANFRKSTFLTKEKDGKLELYHVWDFDITLGNCDYWGEGFYPYDFLLKGCVWYNRLFGKDSTWVKAVKDRFNEIYPELSTIPDYIDEQVTLLDSSQDRNFERWPILGKKVWPNAVWPGTYEAEIAYLKKFYTQRLEWLKVEINKL